MKVTTCCVALLILVFTVVAAQDKPTIPQALASAKTLCIVVPEDSNLDLRAELAKTILKWGKLTVVTSPDEADLVLKVEQTRGFSAWKGKGARGAALLTDRRHRMELWSTSEGGDWSMSGYSIGKVARKIGNKLIKFYETQTKSVSKT